jgi:hypothetical protein
VVAGREVVNGGTGCFYDACAFVAKHDRQRCGGVLLSNVGVGLAHASRHQPDEHLVAARLVEFEQLVNQRVTGAVCDRRSNLHDLPLR